MLQQLQHYAQVQRSGLVPQPGSISILQSKQSKSWVKPRNIDTMTEAVFQDPMIDEPDLHQKRKD